MGNKDNNIFSLKVDKKETEQKIDSDPNSKVDYFQTPLPNNAKKEILLINLQNENLEHGNASEFIKFVKNKLETDYRLIIFDFSASVLMDSVFLGSVILLLKMILKKKLEACLIFNTEKFTSLHNVEYSVDRLNSNVKIFSTMQQVEDHFEIKNINDQMFTLSKVV